VYEVGVAYKERTDTVVEIIKQVGAAMRSDGHFGPLMLEDVEVFGVNEFADSAVMIKGRIKTKSIRQWEVGREFLRRVKLEFDAQGIEIPFPHRTLYYGEASQPFAISSQGGKDPEGGS
jgi:small-conductance mechanosensitive channel